MRWNPLKWFRDIQCSEIFQNLEEKNSTKHRYPTQQNLCIQDCHDFRKINIINFIFLLTYTINVIQHASMLFPLKPNIPKHRNRRRVEKSNKHFLGRPTSQHFSLIFSHCSINWNTMLSVKGATLFCWLLDANKKTQNDLITERRET